MNDFIYDSVLLLQLAKQASKQREIEIVCELMNGDDFRFSFVENECEHAYLVKKKSTNWMELIQFYG